MKQTAGKIYAREYFYLNYLASFMTPRQLKCSNVLTLLGEDFREIELLEQLQVPPYRVFSVERDHAIYRKQQSLSREEAQGVALYYGELADYVHSHLRHHEIAVFNLDICGSYLRAVDPVLGQLLLHVRRMPHTVMATYSSAGRDRPQLMEGLKSLVILLWLAPEVVDRLVRHIYGQYRSAALSSSDLGRAEISRNMLLRHMFWLRSHMEHIMVGAHTLALSDADAVSNLFAAEEALWQSFIDSVGASATYGDVLRFVETQSRPALEAVRMDLDFGDVEFLTYAANDGFYHNCYFATYESTGSTVPLDTWLVESSKSLRRNPVVLIDAGGNRYDSTYGRIAVGTDDVRLWSGSGLEPNLRRVALPPRADDATETDPAPADVDVSTVEQIRALARLNPNMTAREISQKLSLQLPFQQVVAHVAVARRTKL